MQSKHVHDSQLVIAQPGIALMPSIEDQQPRHEPPAELPPRVVNTVEPMVPVDYLAITNGQPQALEDRPFVVDSEGQQAVILYRMHLRELDQGIPIEQRVGQNQGRGEERVVSRELVQGDRLTSRKLLNRCFTG